ncbi:Heterokaryon incompatibility protein 6, OR allele [Colletotrichum sidae]|uniref:Heterokaryon incompatibility protein 6, OR allele n=1 Tax=Colletotrichum sidae TaxID=1347389 RepID=A0A4R8SN18_9PEZI|nr:Heterokaryon incompatibility protein 6, OR allele [Colletotrichum sidae]
MGDSNVEFFQDSANREYWPQYDLDRQLNLATFGPNELVTEKVKTKIREWAATKPPPVRPEKNTEALYRPIGDPYGIRVLEIHAGALDSKLNGSLHHCTLEFQHGEPFGLYASSTRCAVSSDDLATPVSYTALSYTWGPPVFDADFVCDGHPMKITTSLESALRHFRRQDHSVVMWIDQICINQADRAEKGQQIPLMSRIYQHAMNTAIWLGDAGSGSDAAIQLLEDISIRLQFATDADLDPAEFERMGLPGPEADIWDSTWNFLSRQWFTRLWIIQEVILSRDPWVVCGDALMVWENLASACMQLATTGVSKWMQMNFSEGAISGSRGDVAQLAWQLDQIKARALGNSTTLFSLMILSRGAQCWDARDKVYGLLGVVDESHQDVFKTTYASDYTAAKLYHAALTHHISLDKRSWSLHEILSAVDHDTSGGSGLPSWVADWSKPRETVAFASASGSAGIYTAHGKFAPQMLKIDAEVNPKNDKELKVKGLFFDKIAGVSEAFDDPDLFCTDPASKNQALLVAHNFVSRLEEYAPPHTVFSAFWHTLVAGKDGPGRLKCPESFAEVVSLILDESSGISPSLPGQTYSKRQLRPKGRGKLELENLKSRAPGETFQEIRTATRRALRNRRLGITSNGYLGLFPKFSVEGDEVYVLDGCHVPFLLRNAGEGKFRLVGEVYVCGIMGGEAVSADASLTDMILA